MRRVPHGFGMWAGFLGGALCWACLFGVTASATPEGAKLLAMRPFAPTLAAGCLAACATVSGVTPLGDGSFLVSSHGVAGNGSGQSQRVTAVQAANAHCAGLGKHAEVVRAELTEPGFGRPPAADVTFRCL